MTENKEKLLEIKGLTVSYHTDSGVVRAVTDVSLKLDRGETLGLVGETGAGKTTIAKAIMRILQEPPAKVESGEIVFDGKNLLKYSEKEMRDIRGRRISMVFQDPMTSLNPIERIGDQISETLRIHTKMGKVQARYKALEILNLVGITEERYDEYPHQFSGGMKQRVVIAMALACNPELLLADEPTTALDVTIQAQVLDMMEELKRKLNTAMIMITHDLGIVARSCQKVAVVYAGRIMEFGTLKDIFDHFSHPYTEGLFGAVPNLKMKDKRLRPIDGLMPDPMNLPEGCEFHPRCPYATEECRHGVIEDKELSEGHLVRCLHPVCRESAAAKGALK